MLKYYVEDCLVEPVSSGHPRGIAKWPLNTSGPLNTGCTKFGSEHDENAILYYS